MKALVLQFLKEMQNKGSLNYYENHPLSLVSTFGIGGEAGVFVRVKEKDALCELINFLCGLVPYKVIGCASNLLFSDLGFNGAVISTKALNFCSLSDTSRTPTDTAVFDTFNVKKVIFADCGCALSRLCEVARDNGISGFEGLCSIPATVGGAVINNAGAFGCEIADTLLACEVYYPELGKKLLRPIASGDLSYRKSRLKDEGGIILSAYFAARDGERSLIVEKMQKNKALRAFLQPQGVRSAGSFFKRPTPFEGYIGYRGKSAGELIDLCSLKGLTVGGASVSEKHANFIVNASGKATAEDVFALKETIKREVFEKTGVLLSEEVEYVPFDPSRKE
jgi:UDP-N-acetylmuramate dehydrogenase